LVERGVTLVPSALSQALSRSKVLQAAVLGPWMPPSTHAVYDIHQLLEILSAGGPLTAGAVITKADRGNAGLGVHYWNSLEDIYTQAGLGSMPFPFVVQPFFQGARDVRIIVIGDYVEAYERRNRNSFRNNLHCGGESLPYRLDEKERGVCRAVMERGRFPYAHIDLLLTAEGEAYLMEINLRGGIRGARITPEEYRRRIDERHRRLAP